MFHCRSLVEEHHALLTEYEEKTSEMRNDYQDLREKDENSFNSMHRLDSKINDIQVSRVRLFRLSTNNKCLPNFKRGILG